MHRIFLLLVFLFWIQYAFGQVQSNCTDNAALIAKEYKYDIHYLTVEKLRSSNHPDKHLIRIPEIHTDSVLLAITAVYNTGNKIHADSVFDKYCVHDKYAIYSSLDIMLDSNATWANNWINGITETGNDTIDNLLKEYGYRINKDANFHELISDQLVNRFALCDSLQKISGIRLALPTGYIRPGWSEESIYYYVDNNVQKVDFFRPWRDGDYNAHRWIYSIDKNYTVSLEDTVYFLSVEPNRPYPKLSNCNISSNILRQDLKIYPNPNSGQAIIRTSEDGIITIYSLSGKRLKKYISYKGYTNVEYSNLANGIYFIQHHSVSGKIETQKIVKN